MERLVALCVLWFYEFCDKEIYSAELDRLFLKSPENDTLLMLETYNRETQHNRWQSVWLQLEPLIADRELFEAEFLAAFGDYYEKNPNPRVIAGGFDVMSWCVENYIADWGELIRPICRYHDFDYLEAAALYEERFGLAKLQRWWLNDMRAAIVSFGELLTSYKECAERGIGRPLTEKETLWLADVVAVKGVDSARKEIRREKENKK